MDTVLQSVSDAFQQLEQRYEELHRLEQSLWIERQRFHDFFNFAPDGYAITDRAGKILEANQTTSRLLCLPQQLIVGQYFSSFVRPADLSVLSQHMEQARQSHAAQCQVTLQSHRAGDVVAEVEISPAYDLHGQLIHLRWLIRDIGAYRQVENHCSGRSLYDALTGLPNRELFLQQLEQALERPREPQGAIMSKLAILQLDLDGFKHINDSLGQRAGDQLLVVVAQRLLACMRPHDVVARLGGDEFAILLDHIHDEASGLLVGDRVHQALSNPIEVQGQRVFVTASIGVAFADVGSTDLGDRQPITSQQMIGDADVAMYRAKAQGTGQTQVFTQRLRSDADPVVLMRTEFRDALENQEFLLHYQPIVNIHTQRLEGVEALVRWQHPRLGLISYDRFLAAARRTKALSLLEYWIFWKACSEVKAWIDRYALDDTFALHINVSAHRLAEESFVEDVAMTLVSTQFPADQLTIEVTENSLIDDPERMAEVLQQLQSLGIVISLDDFGSGYSSLSHLCMFPISEIKIDPLFIRHLHERDRLAEIVNNTINLGQDLKLNIIAEGIETESQRSFLTQTGCQLGQGYLFSKPLAAEPIVRWLTAQDTSV
jgi:diguanylate cyclase (GGDEF)-like protein/PAS domain S-box-containing protein